MEYEDRVRIETPEGVELELALAGVGSRLAARLVDVLIQAAIGIGLIAALGLTVDTGSGSEAVAIIAAVVITFAVFWGYNVAFEVLNSGRTPGKMALGLRVVGDEGEPETFSMSAVRNLLRIIDEFATAFLAGTISIVVSKENQRLGDMAAGTIVVKERTAEAKVFEPTASFASVEKLRAAQAWDLSAITQEDYGTARRFLQRRLAIAPRARATIARDLAARLRPKVPNSDQVPVDEHFLELMVSVKSQR